LFGQRAVVSTGLVIAGAGLAIVAATSSLTSSYWLFAIGLVVQALGMGITTAPSTGAIMRSLPLHKAGVGSAVNDTTRELGGALGVAVMGSLLASIYRDGLPASSGAASQSLGAGVQAGGAVADAARAAYVHAFDVTLLIAAGVALVAS